MYKIGVISDSHGEKDKIEDLMDALMQCDYVIHLGDGYSDMDDVECELGSKLIRIVGNCDCIYPPVKETSLSVGGIKILGTHGHRYGVKKGLEEINRYAVTNGYNLVLYGHTHEKRVDKIGNVTFINPGSLAYGYSGDGFLIIEIDGGKIKVTD